MRKNLMLSLVLIILFTGCEKSIQETPISLTGKWTVENQIVKEFANGILGYSNITPGDGRTIDFQANGNMIESIPGLPDVSTPYSMKPGSKVEFNGEIYEIKTLTATNASLFIRRSNPTGEYTQEVTINLKR